MTDDLLDTTLVAIQAVEHGWAVTPIPKGKKGPEHREWNLKKNALTTREQVLAHRGCNFGVLDAYSRICVADADILDEAVALLARHGIAWQPLYDAPDGVRLSSGQPNKAKLMFRVPPDVDPATLRTLQWRNTKSNVVYEMRCSDSSGLSVQDVFVGLHPKGTVYQLTAVHPLIGDIWDPPVLPPELLALWRSEMDRRHRAVEVDDFAHDVTMHRASDDTVEELRVALKVLNPIGYQQWVDLSHGIKDLANHRPDLHDALYELWLDWTMAADNYKAGDELKWDQLKPNGRVTYKSVFKAAADLGWVNPRKKTDPATIDVTVPLVAPEAAPEPTELRPLALDDLNNPFFPKRLTTLFEQPRQTWWIKTVIPRAEMGAIIGARSSAKTFFSLDLAIHLAAGWAWRGLRTAQTSVAVIAGEGAQGYRTRVELACREYKLDPEQLPLHVIDAPPNVLDEKQLTLLAKGLKRAPASYGCAPYGVVFVDTLAAVSPGANENTSEDMGRLVAAAKRLHAVLNATIVFIHHLGKDADRGARGWSGLGAALDFEITVQRPMAERTVRLARLSKSKDSQDGQEWAFDLKPLVLCLDADGDPITSALVVPVDDAGPGLSMETQAEKLKGRPRAAWRAWVALRGEYPGGAAPMDAMVDKVVELMAEPPPEEGEDRRARVARRAIRALADRGFFGADEGWVWSRSGGEFFSDFGGSEEGEK